MERDCWKKTRDLDEKVKLKGDLSTERSIDLQHQNLEGKVDNYMFHVNAFQFFHAYTS
jgi:hypothetical protein